MLNNQWQKNSDQMSDSYRTPATICWHCNRLLDAASGLNDSQKPSKEAVSLCLYCGIIGIYDKDLIVRQPTIELLDKLFEDKEFMHTYMEFQWVRQYVSITEKEEE